VFYFVLQVIYNIIIVNYIPIGKHIGLVKKSMFARVFIYLCKRTIAIDYYDKILQTTDLSTILLDFSPSCGS